MGIHSELSNRTSNKRTRSRHKMARRRVEKQVNRGHVGRIVGEVAHPELVSVGMIKKRKHNKRTNVTLSGKKKRRMMKQLKYTLKEKAQMEVEQPASTSRVVKDVEMVEPKKTQKKTPKKTKKDKKLSAPESAQDVEMSEET